MASPFQLFRKHQKWMIATTGLLAIFAFVFADMLSSYSGGQGQNNPDVVKTHSGTIKEFELSRMVHMQRVINTFQQQAFMAAFDAGGRPSIQPAMRSDTEREVVRTRLLAEKAEQLGFVISDDFINHYIRQITGDAVNGEKLRDIVSNMSFSDRQPVSMDMIFSGLRESLMASKLEETYVTSVNVTPAQAWENFLKLEDQVTLEVLPVAVADFVDQVPEPSKKELEEFFEKYKTTEKLPHLVGGVQMESPDPGFRQPRRAVFQYVEADFDKFLDLTADEVTEKEIAEYYENNKDQEFTKAELLPVEEDEEPKDKAEDKTPEDKKTTETKDEDSKDTEEPAKDEADDKQTPEKPEPPGKKEPEPAEASKDQPQGEKPPEPQSSADGLERQLQLVALQDETNESEVAAEEVEKTSAKDDPETVETSQEDPKPATESGEKKPASEKPSGEKPGKQEFDLTTDQESDKKESGVPDNILEIPELEEKEKKPEYRPLDEVAGEIRKTLAGFRTAEMIERVLRDLSGEMVAYARSRDRYRADHNGNIEGGPEPPDLIELAKQKELVDIRALDALSVHETAPVSYFELAKLPLGESQLISAGQPKYADYVFVGSMAEFRPTITKDQFGGNRYLPWVVEKMDEAVPELDSMRDEVVLSWKMIQARELAKKEAQRLAQIADERKAPLAECFAGEKLLASKINTTDPFSWQTQGAVPRGSQRRPQIRFSEVDHVEGADQEFMKSVFALEDNEVVAVANHDKSLVYVVRLAGHIGTEEALRQRFTLIPRRIATWYQVAEQQNQQQVFTALRESAEEEAGVDWLREPDVSPES